MKRSNGLVKERKMTEWMKREKVNKKEKIALQKWEDEKMQSWDEGDLQKKLYIKIYIYIYIYIYTSKNYIYFEKVNFPLTKR